MPEDTSSKGAAAGAAPKVIGRSRVIRHEPRDVVFESTTDIVRHNEIRGDLAEWVWKECLKSWKLNEGNTAMRLALRDRVTQALIQSTSKDEENLNTLFKFDGEYYPIRTIAEHMQGVSAKNDSHLRVFARSFEGGWFAANMYDSVMNAVNLESRMELAVRCNGPIEHAPFMIDVFDAVYRHSGRPFSSSQLALYTRYRIYRTNKAREAALAVGEVAPRNDMTASTKPRALNAPVSTLPSTGSRMQFGNVRD